MAGADKNVWTRDGKEKIGSEEREIKDQMTGGQTVQIDSVVSRYLMILFAFFVPLFTREMEPYKGSEKDQTTQIHSSSNHTQDRSTISRNEHTFVVVE